MFQKPVCMLRRSLSRVVIVRFRFRNRSCHAFFAVAMHFSQLPCIFRSYHAFFAVAMHFSQLPCIFRSCHAFFAVAMHFFIAPMHCWRPGARNWRVGPSADEMILQQHRSDGAATEEGGPAAGEWRKTTRSLVGLRILAFGAKSLFIRAIAMSFELKELLR